MVCVSAQDVFHTAKRLKNFHFPTFVGFFLYSLVHIWSVKSTVMQLRTFIPRSFSYRSLAVEVICYAYILLFLYAASYKLFDYGYFVRQLGHSPLLKDYRDIIGWLVPASEIAISVLLFFPKTRLLGLYGCTAIMTAFTAYILYILNFAAHIPCSCGGILATMGWHDHLLFNSFFIALSLAGILLLHRPGQPKRT